MGKMAEKWLLCYALIISDLRRNDVAKGLLPLVKAVLLGCKRAAFGVQLHSFCVLKAVSLQVDWSKVRMLKR